MYDELVKELRHLDEYSKQINPTPSGIFKEAADAIEELQEDNAALNGTVSNLIRQIAELSKPRWIPVTERLPEKNQIVVVVQRGKTWDYGQFRGLAYLGGDIRKWNWKNNTTKTVDYWMPKKSALPEPPKEET